jgi:hypothetical protein
VGSASFMRRPWSVLILFVLLGFGVSLALPAEDAFETAYDESETLPYEGSRVFSMVRPQASAAIAKAELSGALRSIFSTKGYKLQFHCVPVSLAILKYSLRC